MAKVELSQAQVKEIVTLLIGYANEALTSGHSEVFARVIHVINTLSKPIVASNEPHVVPPRRGRPPKVQAVVVEQAPVRRGRPPKIKAEEAPKRRGRPPKIKVESTLIEPRRRGRPRKVAVVAENTQSPAIAASVGNNGSAKATDWAGVATA